ncbi:MAG TPA: OadG-related small transporter subunit [Tissierellaceae bacterium]
MNISLFELMIYGMGATFFVLILFYLLIKMLVKFK